MEEIHFFRGVEMGLGRSYSWEFAVLLILPREPASLVRDKFYADSLLSSKHGVGVIRKVSSDRLLKCLSFAVLVM